MILFPTIFVLFWTLSMALLGLAAWLGYAMQAPGHGHWLMLHMLAGLLAAFANVLLHTAVMMHLVGTGRSIKLAKPHVRSGRDYLREQLPLKNRSYPLATVASLAAVATAILGGARNFGLVPTSIHAALAWTTVAANVLALPWDLMLLRKNGAVVLALEAELEKVVEEMDRDGTAPKEGPMPWQV
jgi:hypothetical protein